MNAFTRDNNRALEQLLTRSFFALYERAMKAYDGDRAAPFCSDTDSDLIECLFYPADQWLEPVTSHADPITSQSASMTVLLPPYLVGDEYKPSKQIFVTLTVERGAWRISKVTDQKP